MYLLRWRSLDCKISVNHIKQSPSHKNRAVFQQCYMTPAGDVSYSQKKRAMLPGLYSFRALGITMIEDCSCGRLQEISGNNVVILFQRNVQYCYPRNWLNSARTLLNIQQLAVGSHKTSFLPNIFGICCWPTIIIVTQNCWNGFSSEHVSV